MSEARKRAPFELLAFTAAPVVGALVVVELGGRFPAQGGRFTRQPVLVVEPSDDRPRLELAPIRATLEDGRWRSAYAIPAEVLPNARFALGLRGTLLELPAPDEPDNTDHLTALAREANSLRRALEAAQADVTSARAEADATAAELDAARAEAIAQTTAGHEQALAEATARADAAEQRGADAEARAHAAQQAARAAESGAEVLRAELAEERAQARTVVADPKSITPALTHQTSSRGPGPWIAVGALVLFAFVLLGLLAGFLA